MKLGVMSDSHDNVPWIRSAIAALEEGGADWLVHAGDFVAPFAVREVLKFKGKVIGVFGNNDGEKEGIRKLLPEVHDAPHWCSLGGRRICICHDIEAMPMQERRRADLIIAGHTHASIAEAGPPLVVNPGECGGWLTGYHTVAVVDLEGMAVDIIYLTKR